MRLKEHLRQLEAAVLAEREECAKLIEYYAGFGNAHRLSQLIRSRTLPVKGLIRPETAEKHPEKLAQGYKIAGQGLSADGERIIGNGRGSEHPVKVGGPYGSGEPCGLTGS